MIYKQINQMYNEKKKREKQLYSVLTENVKNKILFAAKNGSNYCYFDVPIIMVGFPKIDTEKVMIYLYKVLTKDNFKCFPVTETTLFIYWEYTEEEQKEKPKKQEEYRQPEIDNNFINSILASKKA